MPAHRRPGSIGANSCAPPKPTASIMNTAAITGEPRIVEIAANAPETPISATRSGRLAQQRPHERKRRAAAEREQDGLRPDHRAEA